MAADLRIPKLEFGIFFLFALQRFVLYSFKEAKKETPAMLHLLALLAEHIMLIGLPFRTPEG